jgi:hypothetical protein
MTIFAHDEFAKRVFEKSTTFALTPNPSPKLGRGESEPQVLAG